MRAEAEIECHETSLCTIAQSFLSFAREERYELLKPEPCLENLDHGDPIDDEQDATDINQIDLKNDAEAVVKGDHSDASKQFLAESTNSCLQRVATPYHLNDNTKVGGECAGGGSAQLADETKQRESQHAFKWWPMLFESCC